MYITPKGYKHINKTVNGIEIIFKYKTNEIQQVLVIWGIPKAFHDKYGENAERIFILMASKENINDLRGAPADINETLLKDAEKLLNISYKDLRNLIECSFKEAKELIKDVLKN